VAGADPPFRLGWARTFFLCSEELLRGRILPQNWVRVARARFVVWQRVWRLLRLVHCFGGSAWPARENRVGFFVPWKSYATERNPP
jgi:hypothetical protein